jgi:hypothetical protein
MCSFSLFFQCFFFCKWTRTGLFQQAHREELFPVPNGSVPPPPFLAWFWLYHFSPEILLSHAKAPLPCRSPSTARALTDTPHPCRSNSLSRRLPVQETHPAMCLLHRRVTSAWGIKVGKLLPAFTSSNANLSKKICFLQKLLKVKSFETEPILLALAAYWP